MPTVAHVYDTIGPRRIRALTVVLLALVLAVAGSLVGSFRPPQAGELEWPIQLRYEISSSRDDDVLASSTYEFRGDGWDDWTDVVVGGKGPDEHRAQIGLVQRAEDDARIAGWITERPDDTSDGFLPDSFYEKFPENAVHVERYALVSPEISPNGLFNGGYARVSESRPSSRSEPGSEESERRVAAALGLDPASVASSRRVVAACEAETLEACGPERYTVEFVFHREARVPLEVRELAPDGVTRTMVVIRVKHSA